MPNVYPTLSYIIKILILIIFHTQLKVIEPDIFSARVLLWNYKLHLQNISLW